MRRKSLHLPMAEEECTASKGLQRKQGKVRLASSSRVCLVKEHFSFLLCKCADAICCME
jgi:hypothetical protein